MSNQFSCPCGKLIDETNWRGEPYKITIRNKDGNLVYAVCVHNIAIIDELDKFDPEICSE